MGTKYFIVEDLILMILYLCYFLVFAFLGTDELSDDIESFFGVFLPYFKDHEPHENYLILKNLLSLSLIHVLMITLKTIYGVISWYNDFSRKHLEVYFQLILVLYLYWLFTDILIVCITQ